MSKKNAILVQIKIEPSLVKEMVDECNRRIKLEFRIKNIQVDDDYDWSKTLQTEENIRNSLVNSIVSPVRGSQKGLSPVQIRNYNKLIDILVTEICENKSEVFTVDINIWKLIKSHWEHDGEKIFSTAILDALTTEYFHEKIFSNIKELTTDDVEPKVKENNE